MPDPGQVINSYLVSLGFSVDRNGMRRFQDALHDMAASVEKYTKSPLSGIGPMFLSTAGAIAGAIAGIGAATVGLLSHTANTDLSMQLFARRMFMSTNAARDMKMALDALGVSLEDVIFGPPELRERYQQLMADERRMGLGQNWEQQMRQIRDVQFQFTRMWLEAQRFAMYFAGDVSRALFGDKGDLEANLKQFNEKFIEKMPYLADQMANVVAPAMREFYEQILRPIGQWAADPKNLQKMIADIGAVGGAIVSVTKSAGDLITLFHNNWDAFKAIFGYGLGGAAVGGAVAGPVGAMVGAAAGAGAGWLQQYLDLKYPQDWTQAAQQGQFKLWALQAAAKYKIDPSMLMGVFGVESGTKWGWNPNAYNRESGAAGIGQFLPGTAAKYGLTNPFDPQANIAASAHYLSDLIRQYGGWDEALKHYGGWVTKDPSGYIGDVRKRAQSYGMFRDRDMADGFYSPMAYHPEVHVHVGSTSATPEQIAHAVRRELDEHDRSLALQINARTHNAYA